MASYLLKLGHSVTVLDDKFAVASVCYQSDGWSCWVSPQNSSSVGDVRVVRTGKVRKEFLIERAIYRGIPSTGEIVGSIAMTPPRLCCYYGQDIDDHNNDVAGACASLVLHMV